MESREQHFSAIGLVEDVDVCTERHGGKSGGPCGFVCESGGASQQDYEKQSVHVLKRKLRDAFLDLREPAFVKT